MDGGHLTTVYGAHGVIPKKNDTLSSVLSKLNTQWVTYTELVTCVRY